MKSFLVLEIWVLLSVSFAINPNVQNSSHQIYLVDNALDSNIECRSPNCIIQCMVKNSCAGIRINAISIYNVNVLCAAFDSCNNIDIKADNHTNITLDCFDAHSCSQSSLYVTRSYLQLQCTQDGSCQDMEVIINEPPENSVSLSCNTDHSCKNLEIRLISIMSINMNWINILMFTDNLNVIIFCNGGNRTELFHSDKSNNIECSDDTMCCPSNYRFIPNATVFYSTLILTEVTEQESNDLFWIVGILMIYASLVLCHLTDII